MTDEYDLGATPKDYGTAGFPPGYPGVFAGRQELSQSWPMTGAAPASILPDPWSADGVSRRQDAFLKVNKDLVGAQSADARQVGGDHYKQLAVEPWTAMESWLTPEEFRGFLKGNAIKYLARANSGKEKQEDAAGKAAHYLQKLTELLAKAHP